MPRWRRCLAWKYPRTAIPREQLKVQENHATISLKRKDKDAKRRKEVRIVFLADYSEKPQRFISIIRHNVFNGKVSWETEDFALLFVFLFYCFFFNNMFWGVWYCSNSFQLNCKVFPPSRRVLLLLQNIWIVKYLKD